MARLVILALCAEFAAPLPAAAAVLDDFLARDYTVAAATRLPGSFTGCIRQHRLVFADGSVFACARTKAQTAYEPRVTIFRLGGGPPSAVLVGSHVLAGQLLRLRLHEYAVPLRMNADPLGGVPAKPSAALQPLRATPSITAIMQMQDAPLAQQAQITSLARQDRLRR